MFRDKKSLFAENSANGVTPSLGVVLGSRVVILGLGKSVSTAGGLEPGSSGVSSTLLVEFVKAKELASLLDVEVVLGGGLRGISVTNLLVFLSSQTSRNIRAGRDGPLLDLKVTVEVCGSATLDVGS